MKTNLLALKLVAFILLTAIPYLNFAQNKKEGAANINKIATLTDGKIDEYKSVTSSAQIKRSNQDDWLNVKKNEELFFNDILKLDKNIWLRVNIKNKIQQGSISLLQNPEDLNQSGKYKITEDNDGSGRVAIELIQGYAIINIFKDFISTITGGLQSVVKSNSPSRALYLVRPDGSGEIFLKQGHLTFPGNPVVSELKVGEVAQFKDGQIINVFFPDVPLATKYNDFTKFNNSTVWKKSFWKRPVTWIGAAAVGIGTTLIIVQPWNSGNKQVTGTININWGGN